MSYQALLFCPDEKTARVVTQVLTDLEFSVEACSEPFAAVKKLMAQHFDAIVVDCENEQNATLLFKSARNSGSNQSALAVAVVEGQSGVAKAFRIGANLVLTKPINVEQSKGTLRVARGLLRKADSYKPATTAPARPVASPAPFRPASPAIPAASVASKPAFGGFPAQRASSENAISEATSSAFELQQDPTPAPEPTEVALLESMSDSIDSKRPSQPATASGPSKEYPSKEYPWQPVSKPLSEPMASALKRAAEAANKTEATPPAFPSDSSKLRPAAHSMPSAHGAASAPAPARETPRPTQQMVQPHPAAAKISPSVLDEIEIAPAFGTSTAAPDPGPEPLLFATMQDEPEASGSSKKLLIIAALVVLAVAGAYFYATQHPEIAPAALQKYVGKPGASVTIQTQAPTSVQPQPVAPAQTSAPSSSSSPTIVTPAGTSDHGADAANSQTDPVETSPITSHPVQEAKPSAGKTASTNSVVNTEIAGSTPAPSNRVLTVAKSKPLVKTAPPAPEVVTPPTPLSLGVGSSTDKEIAGIANGAPATMPKAATAGTVKISQGVTQGLLVKRVPPSYPQSAKQMHIQGTVQLQANIGKDGSVSNVKALSGDPALAHAAIEAVKQWKYRPYTLNNEPVEIQTQITVNFKLP